MRSIAALGLALLTAADAAADPPPEARVFYRVTHPDRSLLFARPDEPIERGPATPEGRAIDVDATRTFQTIDGDTSPRSLAPRVNYQKDRSYQD
jgi:hypothetical protein